MQLHLLPPPQFNLHHLYKILILKSSCVSHTQNTLGDSAQETAGLLSQASLASSTSGRYRLERTSTCSANDLFECSPMCLTIAFDIPLLTYMLKQIIPVHIFYAASIPAVYVIFFFFFSFLNLQFINLDSQYFALINSLSTKIKKLKWIIIV